GLLGVLGREAEGAVGSRDDRHAAAEAFEQLDADARASDDRRDHRRRARIERLEVLEETDRFDSLYFPRIGDLSSVEADSRDLARRLGQTRADARPDVLAEPIEALGVR